MHDAKVLLEPYSVIALARRGHVLDLAVLGDLVKRRADLLHQRDALRAELNRSPDRSRVARERLSRLEHECRASETDLRDLLLRVPNLPAREAPDGGAAEPGVELRRWGEPPELGFAARDHAELGRRLGILDPVRAAKVSGARFAVTRGAAARLERALRSMLLDLHTNVHGYQEYGIPHLVTRETMTGTGQLPKFADDLFATGVPGRELMLIPTAEVPLVNLYRDEVLDESALPLALVAHSPCYRREAGSYGRDTRGLIRVHQFDKVELVRLCHPDRAAGELDLLVGHAEACLRLLELHYRVVELRAGDLGFAARRTYDLEVWLPGQSRYREISSCSDCGTFQARRAGIRIRTRSGSKVHAATLNGSALPIGRTLAAILEQHQRADGSVAVPAALAAHAGFTEIRPGGIGGSARSGAVEER